MAEKSVSLNLRRLGLYVRRFMEANSHRKTIEQVTGTNSWIIGYIADHPDRDVFQRDLENVFGITRSTASKTVDALVEKGFVERTPVDYDARLKKLVLTKKASEVLDLMKEDRAMLESVITAGFSDGELEALHGYIERITENIEAYSEGSDD